MDVVSHILTSYPYCIILFNTFLISHKSTNLHQTLPKESFKTIKSYSDLAARKVEFHNNQYTCSSCSLTSYPFLIRKDLLDSDSDRLPGTFTVTDTF